MAKHPTATSVPMWVQGLLTFLALEAGVITVAALALDGYGPDHGGFSHVSMVLAVAGAATVAVLSTVVLWQRTRMRERAALADLGGRAKQFEDMTLNVPGVIYQWYERSDGTRGFHYVSPRTKDFYGVDPEDYRDDFMLLAIHPEDQERWDTSIRESLETMTPWQFEGRFILPDGTVRWWEGRSQPMRVSPEEVVFNGLIVDIDAHKRREAELEATRTALERRNKALVELTAELHDRYAEAERQREDMRVLAETDTLTGLPNRRSFFLRAQDAFDQCEESSIPFSVLVLDIDHFKRVNDTYGHKTGDEVLVKFAARLQRCAVGSDVLARVGGEEFAVALPGCDTLRALGLAEDMRTLVAAEPMSTEVGPITVSVSIGVAQAYPAETDMDWALRRADQALYRAKAEGRNRSIAADGPLA